MSPLRAVVQDAMDSRLKTKEGQMGLTISRKRGEKVVLQTAQGPIEIEITEINSNRIRMRFECSRDIVILRKEIIGRDDKKCE